MFKPKEIFVLILALIVLSFSNSFIDSKIFINSLFAFAIILLVYTLSKKLTAYYYEAEEETKIWSFQRYGLYERSYFKKPIPIGIILPFILSILTFGAVPWFAVIESDVKPTEGRAARRHDFYSFSEMTEFQLALISASGIFSCLIIAVLAYIINFPDLARLAVYFAAFNMLPLGKLDGTKVFFGSKILYSILGIVTLIALAYAVFLP